jgi:hypothetical protein
MAEQDVTPPKLIYDFFLDETSRVGQRTDWFLIFHGILLEAFFAAPVGAAQVFVGILGFLTSYLWFMTGYRQRWLLRHLGACMGTPKLMGAEVSELFERIFKMRRKGIPRWVEWAAPVPAFSVVIPFAFAVAWFSLLLWTDYTRLVGAPTAGLAASIIANIRIIMRLVYASAAGLAGAIIATFWIKRLVKGPKIPVELTEGLLNTTSGESADKKNPTLS